MSESDAIHTHQCDFLPKSPQNIHDMEKQKEAGNWLFLILITCCSSTS